MNFFFSFHDCYSCCCYMSYFFFSNWCIWFFFFITGSIVNLWLLPIFFVIVTSRNYSLLSQLSLSSLLFQLLLRFFFFDYFVHFIHRCDSGLFFHWSCISHFCTWDSVFIQFFFPAHLFNFIYVFFKSIMWFINCNFFFTYNKDENSHFSMHIHLYYSYI